GDRGVGGRGTLSAEERLLGGLLVGLIHWPAQVEPALAGLEPRYFTASANCLVFSAVAALRRAGAKVDLVSVADFLRRSGEIWNAGGCLRLAELWVGAWGPGKVAPLARSLIEQDGADVPATLAHNS